MSNSSMGDIVKRKNPVTLPDTATVQLACRMMRDQRVGAILVTGTDGRLDGLFTGRDAVGRVVAEALDPERTQLRAVMTVEPDTLRAGGRAIDAMRMMLVGGYRHLPVVDGSRIVGVVSRGDFTCPERTRIDEETGFCELM